MRLHLGEVGSGFSRLSSPSPSLSKSLSRKKSRNSRKNVLKGVWLFRERTYLAPAKVPPETVESIVTSWSRFSRSSKSIVPK